MNISSVVLRTRPELADAVRAELDAIAGVEVHVATADGRLVITVEDSTLSSAADTFVRLHSVAGVFAVSMVYQYSDETDSEEVPS